VEFTRSVNGVPIRLSDERWGHIIEFHDDLVDRAAEVLDAVAHPAWVTRGYGGPLIAWKPFGQGRFLSVIYRELGVSDGFIITAFFTSKARKENRVWP